MFKSIVEKHFVDNYEKNITTLDSLIELQNKRKIKGQLSTTIYNMKIMVDYKKVKSQIKEAYSNVIKKDELGHDKD